MPERSRKVAELSRLKIDAASLALYRRAYERNRKAQRDLTFAGWVREVLDMECRVQKRTYWHRADREMDAWIEKIRVEPERLEAYKRALARMRKQKPGLTFSDWMRGALDAWC